MTRLVGAMMPKKNFVCAITRRLKTLETVAAICNTATMHSAMIAAL
ncbi:MAG: hypothetical protein AAFU41_06915 [Pseudomonadota bacterium]